MKIRGPLVTLGAVVAVGTGMWLVNVSQEPAPAPVTAPAPAAAPTSVAIAAPPAPPTPPKQQFPPKADYAGTVPIRSGELTVDISVNGTEATAYICDNQSIEVWLRGTAVDGVLTLASKDKTSKLNGKLSGSTVAGTLYIGAKNWKFTSTEVGKDVY